MAVFFFDNKFVEEKEAKLNINSEAFLYGFSLFETMRAFKGKIIYLDAHLERIINSAKTLDLKVSYDKNKLKRIILRVVKLNRFKSLQVRLIFAKDKTYTHTLVTAKKYNFPFKKYKVGYSVCVYNLRQFSKNFLINFKSSNYLFYLLAYRYAKTKGFDDAIILNEKEKIAETSRANIFWLKKNRLFTPHLECGCLPGITRKVIFDLADKLKIKIIQTEASLKELLSSQEAFLTNSLIGVMPLVRVEESYIGKGKPGLLTQRILKEYQALYDAEN